jgi:UDP-N-acetyl-D-mannosaminuronic acid transferase (WecB/TagA/CpsF family)
MPIDHTAVQTHTDAQLLALYRDALAKIATGQSYSINGRSLTHANLKEVRDMIDWLEARVQTATDGVGGNIALAQFKDAQ